jgi:choline dehydrogenase-like flavoprotein
MSSSFDYDVLIIGSGFGGSVAATPRSAAPIDLMTRS